MQEMPWAAEHVRRAAAQGDAVSRCNGVDTSLDLNVDAVLFALEWCEFCWSLRKLCAACAIPYRSVDLDSSAYQADNRGGNIRAVLAARTGSKTVPQLFVAGEWIGGTSETAAFKQGQLQAMLREHSVPFDEKADVDSDALLPALLPAWLHPR